jgi:hypothetical protein
LELLDIRILFLITEHLLIDTSIHYEPPHPVRGLNFCLLPQEGQQRFMMKTGVRREQKRRRVEKKGRKMEEGRSERRQRKKGREGEERKVMRIER